ncbi:unnamed protein product [Ilex paraguariensis]|uniref:VQ domain-containing protein n=1 Tax=Ilex paraguariensis TaxID=185542 RepID=A0ABC8USK5_9AQUA
MDNPLGVQQKKATKLAKTKKKPLKIVYISNPMKVKTSASEFRALVQELTGQDAELPDPVQFPVADHQVVPDATVSEDQAHQVPRADPGGEVAKPSDDSDFSSEPYDDGILMLENFPGLLPSNLWFESAHDDVLKSLE